ncbi:RNA polymerase sigma factor [Baekduia alba]|uniref:sigma-70 family RNA polymerase sigma factor n=1 Tax=Baekduia alba TaxID=2997333 RepID=UPI00233FACAE|nr:sigma-70 family RNA polymerase sigma factor [Baekduia alba]WCB92838.1 RNA polymerase sigma factor [Baekduia alba]
MAALAPTLPIPRLAAKRDDELVARVRGGDEGAFAELHDRHRASLVRYARRVLGERPPGAEDVVQEVFLKAHAELLRDDRPMQLRAWLHRLVRNRCLDELRRAGNAASLPIDDMAETAADRGATAADPADVVDRRHRVRHMLEDIATLPDRQREVLLRREVDGATHEQVAADLGITVRASKNLANRARENLARRADARGAACVSVREDLVSAHERRRRASAHAHRHLTTCRDCRRFRAQLGTVRGALRMLTPGPALAPLATLLGGWTALSGAGAGAGLKLAAAGAVTAVLAGGAVEFSEQVALPGERAPFTVHSVIFTGGLQLGGRHVPHGTAIVTRKLTLAAGSRHPAVTLPCPTGTRVAGLTPAADGGTAARVGYGYSAGTLLGTSTTAHIVFEPKRLHRSAPITVGTLCKRPDATGSLLAAPAFAAEKRVHRVCADRAYLFETPSRFVVGTVFRNQPVVIKTHDKSGMWVRVVTDAGVRGWLRRSVVSRGSRC